MFDPVQSTEEHALGRRLREEASRSKPNFSESLHERIVRGTERRRMEEALQNPVPVGRRLSRSTASVMAAACVLLCLVVIGWRVSENVLPRGAVENPRVVAANNVAEDPILDILAIEEFADSATASLDGFVATARFGTQSAYLEHDVRLTANTLLRRLPVSMELIDEP